MTFHRPTARRPLALLLIAAALLGVGGCSGVQNGEVSDGIHDPFEGLNRAMFDFNMAVDKHIGEPISKAYIEVVPLLVRQGVNNFLTNLTYPHTIANDILQLRFDRALSDTGRLVINSTIGVGGIFDPATNIGLDHNRQNFGVTARVWGLPEGPYIVLPFFGPHTVSSLPDIPLRVVTNPLPIVTGPVIFLDPLALRMAVNAADAVNSVAETERQRRMVREAVSPYAFVRSAYYQRQRRLAMKAKGIEEPAEFEPLPLDELEPEEPDGDEPTPTEPATTEGTTTE